MHFPLQRFQWEARILLDFQVEFILPAGDFNQESKIKAQYTDFRNNDKAILTNLIF